MINSTDILRRIEQADHAPFIVGIDGQGGSGKSTLAKYLASEIGPTAFVVQGDDFYREMSDDKRTSLSPAQGSEQYFDWQRLKEQVLQPAISGSARLLYQRYDWENERLGGYIELEMPLVLIVEGVYTLRPQLRELLDLKIYVSTSERARLQRQKDRGENEDIWIKRWLAAEDYYVNSAKPEDAADIIISGEAD